MGGASSWWASSTGQAPIGMGAMRLSTDSARDDERSTAVLHAAFDAGVNLIDTADAYCWDADEAGHNERLIAHALHTWPGDRSRITVATKGGLTRPDGRWEPDGRAKHVLAAARASCAALGVDRLALYQLHAPDPRVPWLTSLRALASLQRSGVAAAVGLCNVSLSQLEQARQVIDVATVQLELSPWHARNVASGVVPYCIDQNIRVLAYRPFGGFKLKSRLATDPVLVAIAAAHDASPFEVVLAWMRGVGPQITPLPGPTRKETARACGHAARLLLEDDERSALDAHFSLGRLRQPRPARVIVDDRQTEQDIVLMVGLPGAGKTTTAMELVASGYERLNRDERGGTLVSLIPDLVARLDAGASRVVLDNTYLSRASRAPVIDAARARGRRVRSLWVDTSIEDAQVNAVWRMIRAHGRLLRPEEMRRGRDPSAIGPSALFRSQRELEPPRLDEGFSSIDRVPFVRHSAPDVAGRAVIMSCDGVLRKSRSGAARPRSAEDFDVETVHRETLARYQAEGWPLLVVSWEPEMADGLSSEDEVDARFKRIRNELGLELEFVYCPHGGGPPVCWCRKPLPGLGVVLIERHLLDPQQCLYLGTSTADRQFAQRLGFAYQDVSAPPSSPD